MKPVENYHVYKVTAGDILSYGRLTNGIRGYLGIKDGFLFPEVLESSSQYFPLTSKGFLEDGVEIQYREIKSYEPKLTDLKVHNYLDDKELKVALGPEFELLDKSQQKALFENSFSISKENNRMAYQLQETIDGHEFNMLTSATLPGTVQLTPSGKLIILMKDGQTTGGYPRILQLNKASIAVLAQKKAGEKIKFVSN